MSLIEHFNIIESCLSEPSYTNSVLQCQIKFKLIAFHDCLDNQKRKACMSKMANWSFGATTVLSVPCAKTAALPTLSPLLQELTVSKCLCYGTKVTNVRVSPGFLMQPTAEDLTLALTFFGSFTMRGGA